MEDTVRHITPRFNNPDVKNLTPLFEYFPMLFAPIKVKEHRKYSEYIVYNRQLRTYEVYEPIDNIKWENGAPRLEVLYNNYDIPLQRCSEIKIFKCAPNLLCRN